MGSLGGTGPLAGVRVVELGVWVAGPAARRDHGRLGRRRHRGRSPAAIRSGRCSGRLASMGRCRCRRLRSTTKANVLWCSTCAISSTTRSSTGCCRPPTCWSPTCGLGHRALELGPDRVCARHPRLVYGAISGYGLEGQDRDRAGYDIGAFGLDRVWPTRWCHRGRCLPGLRSGMGDHQTGMTLVAGVMGKLFERERTGRGGLVSTSLLRTGMYSIAWDFGIQLRFDRRESTKSRDRSRATLINSYRAGDDRVFWLICLEADRHWPRCSPRSTGSTLRAILGSSTRRPG